MIVRKFDHDFKYKNYLLSCSGIMELETNEPLECGIGEPIPNSAKYTDDLGRERLKIPCTGTSHLMIRPNLAKPDLHTNIAVDMSNFLKQKLDNGDRVSVFAAVVDGGADYINTREATVLLLGRLFRDFGLEGLLLFRRCGGTIYT